MLLLLLQLALMPDARYLHQQAVIVGVPTRAVWAVAYIESRNNLSPFLRGRAGEIGRFQIKASTARRRCVGINIWTHDGNTECFLHMFAADATAHGISEAICRHNGLARERCAYGDRVLAQWKWEEVRR